MRTPSFSYTVRPCENFSPIDEAIAGVVEEARRQGVGHVVWLTLRAGDEVNYSDPQNQSGLNTFREYNEQLVEAAAEQPLVCIIDNAQWLDAESSATLAFVARRLASEPVALVVATRSPIADLVGLPELTVGGLADRDARALLLSALGRPLDRRVRERILAEARGNPGVLLALVSESVPSLMAGGFGLCGIPENLILALRRRGVRGLTIISNNCGIDGKGLGVLLENGQVRRIVASYVGENRTFERLYLEGKLDVELCPQGTLAERIRAGGAGIPAFYTATGVGTPVAEGKETRKFFRPSDDTGGQNRGAQAAGSGQQAAASEQREYVLETGLYADLALVKAWKADEFGNLVYRKTARNFNPMMATAAAFVVAEVEEIVPTGSIEADCIHTPGSYVDRVVRTVPEKRIEQRTVRKG